jgi:histidinol-phosphate/aromatic aminotransferase/cobyric acid decarboxylase-like protein
MSVLPSAGRHGGDGARVAASMGLAPDDVLDLSASLNPVAPDVARAVADHLGELRRYPDPAEATLAMAGALGVEAESVLLTNGGAEAIALVAALLGGSVDEPEFGLHPRTGGPRWRSDPHNPTGLLAGPDQTAAVWDEAFYPLAAGAWTLPGRARHAVVVGSLTKVFACPGLRMGYVLAEPDLVGAVAARQAHWALGSLAAAVIPELLEQADLPRYRREIASLRADLVALLGAHSLDPQPSDANFVLCASGGGLRARLARHGVVVRDCASFGLPGAARVAVPDAAGLSRLATALERSAP